METSSHMGNIAGWRTVALQTDGLTDSRRQSESSGRFNDSHERAGEIYYLNGIINIIPEQGAEFCFPLIRLPHQRESGVYGGVFQEYIASHALARAIFISYTETNKTGLQYPSTHSV
jgi:hypothetical protein